MCVNTVKEVTPLVVFTLYFISFIHSSVEEVETDGNPPVIFSTNANENMHVVLEDILGKEGGKRSSPHDPIT